MGNWFGSWRRKGVQPIYEEEEGIGLLRSSKPSSTCMRVKVRMTKDQLQELMGKVDLSKGSSELAQLIFNQCIEGRFHARVVSYGRGPAKHLSTVWEQDS